MNKLSSSARINYLLHQMEIFDCYDVINHIPRRYEVLCESKNSDFIDKAKVTVTGVVNSGPTFNNYHKIKVVTFSIFSNALKRNFNVTAFNREYLMKTIHNGDEITLWGVFEYKSNRINMINYFSGKINETNAIRPTYSLVSGLDNREYVRIVKHCFKELEGAIYSLVPFVYQNKYRLIKKDLALWYAHFPSNMEQVRQALRHLKYEEALIFSLKNQIIHEENKTLSKVKKEPIGIESCDKFINHLPFKLTSEQFSASKEIIDDMNQNALMYRLLQGDVGTGKTVVSFIALYANYCRGDQGAIMAPTDALAKQHYKTALEMFNFSNIKIVLLTGSTSIKEKNEIYRQLEEGDIDIIIGTHALFTKKIKYSSLGLVVIDEQHRFGVNQRQALLDKGDSCDLLMMSATPIPRSLALTLYGDLDITSLHTFPTLNKDILTKIVNPNTKEIFTSIDNAISRNERVYIVAPLINEKDDRFSVKELEKIYVSHYKDKVAVLHGALKAEEKENALNEFISGNKPILLATQVIEVGIDVKSATVMVIYDATSFGLASLHQLRGRIGRDGKRSICYLLTEDDDENRDKLKILEESFDGFKIAEQDLASRGPGDLAGLRQSGLPDFTYLNVVDDIKIFVTARDDASYIIKHQDEKGFNYVVNTIKKLIEYKPIIKA